MDQAPLTVQDNSPLELVQQFFTKLGARYVVVNDTDGYCEWPSSGRRMRGLTGSFVRPGRDRQEDVACVPRRARAQIWLTLDHLTTCIVPPSNSFRNYRTWPRRATSITRNSNHILLLPASRQLMATSAVHPCSLGLVFVFSVRTIDVLDIPASLSLSHRALISHIPPAKCLRERSAGLLHWTGQCGHLGTWA